MDLFWTLFSIVGYLLTLLLIPIVLLTKKRHSVSTVAWIMAIVILPYLGALLFLVFGINRVERRKRSKQQAALAISRHLQHLTKHYFLPDEALTPEQERMMRLGNRVSATRPTYGNDITLFSDTRLAFKEIETAIREARESVHLEYYIWQPDQTGTRLRDMLIRKAREGVKIRFLFDSIGSMRLKRRFLKPMLDAGIEVASFLPGQTLRERWSINLCNHRKIIITDGTIGFAGGMNVGDEYLGKDPDIGFWRDTHLKLLGPAVLQLQQVFAEDWHYATGQELTAPELFPDPPTTGDVTAQVVYGGPEGEHDVFHTLMFGAINEATKHVTLATSYFVPPETLLMALRTAALRGVRVRLMLAGPATYWWTLLAARSYYEPLLRAGVEIYEYQNGLMHSKTLAIDGGWALVGSPNFDERSLFLNFEVGVAMYDGRFARQLEEDFDQDVKSARKIELEPWQQRPVWHVLSENLCRLFSPVL